MDGKYRKDIHKGQHVNIVLKKDQSTGILTYGVVEEILTNRAYHPRGIKVKLKDNKGVGRVQWIPEIKQ
ncbi:YwbE family protein [Alkaliphilus sp. B6464]|uniref:YwbE family protein n=1 Tax=Alkaliphilus sp. B6464 TaxID=2731219 RepID=UPI001BADBE68|nr:YwbE family protein [Alkaliphilus sp. B6464]QUH21854.1 YwbE family protein [Alkaliphilus sp. B6464]